MNLPSLTIEDFPAFFEELWKHDPFPWQCEFARRLCAGQTPDYVAVPTGSGKTACLDAAVFALAVQAGIPMTERTQGRRIFFIVNRRIIVDEAYNRSERLCEKLEDAPSNSIIAKVATALRGLSGETDAIPLTCTQLRGGIYRDRSWARSPLQPMIVCSTVDQAGSRLLFRGYGVSPEARPIHAALVAHDSLLIIDEAHISRPFIQTLEWVKRYRLYKPSGGETVPLPFQFIQMTATPPADTREDQKIVLTPADREHPVLKPRLNCSKPARMVVESKAKGKAYEEQMAKRLVEEAESILTSDAPPRSIAIMVNRVITARLVAEKLEKEKQRRVTLLIGRMRPLDREATTETIQKQLRTGADESSPESDPIIVVSTQCLEVGADLDFDALVTEAASLDALRQRFGRLNRGGRAIAARAVIVLPGNQDVPLDKIDEATPCDVIYGNAIPQTWFWLKSLGQNGTVDFGINAMSPAIDAFRKTNGKDALDSMFSPTKDAPILLPAYLDCWVQTNPAPAADPYVALFLHGPKCEMAEVQVCWRGDLPGVESQNDWADILSLCPPTALECLPVPLHVFRNWLISRSQFEDHSGDVPEIQQPSDNETNADEQGILVFVWRGPTDRFFAHRTNDLRPGDTIILRAQNGGWEALGNVPGAPNDPQEATGKEFGHKEVRLLDVAETAMAVTRRKAILRIHQDLWPAPSEGTASASLMKMALDEEQDWNILEIKELLKRLLNDENPGWLLPEEQRVLVEHLAQSDVRLSPPEPYPNNQGFALTSRNPFSAKHVEDEEKIIDTDADALLEATLPQELSNHTKDVLDRVECTLITLPLTAWGEALIAAAVVHDWGKADHRFQALLRGTTPFAAMASDKFLAKSRSIPSSAFARNAARERAELPKYFRHEMLSVQMAENPVGATALPTHPVLHALALHLVATHHGHARPLAPVVDDEIPPDVNLPVNGKTITVTGVERLEHPVHALDSGLADRFWQMNRHYGWWGIAFFETVLRLADQMASANPQSVEKS